MPTVKQTREFSEWLAAVRDGSTRARLTAESKKLGRGLRADWKVVAGRVKELRLNYGPGYRLYFADVDGDIVLLLIGGSKRRQSADIERAKELLEEYDG